MALSANPSAREFGDALRRAREAARLTVGGIAERTKIQPRVLAALEDGEFGRLPDQVFARMFLRQYLDLVGGRPEEWLPAFETAWRRFSESSRTFAVRPAPPARKRRVGPWVLGSALVAALVLGVAFVERHEGARTAAAASTAAAAPRAVERQPTPVATPVVTPVVTPAVAPPAAAAPADGLVVRGLEAPCWVEVRVAGGRSSSRLLAAGATWDVDAGGRDVDLVLGDAGAVSVAYLGQVRDPAGRRGEVAHIHLPGRAAPSPPETR